MKSWQKNVAAFLSGQGISLFGSQLVHYAVMWHIARTEQSGAAMLFFTLANAVPTFLVSPFGGVWADRYSKKWLINIADAGIAAVTLVMATLFGLGFENVALLLVCTAVRGFGQGVQVPAVNSFVPEITPEESLTKVNGFNTTVQSIANFTAPMAAGALLSLAPITAILYIDVVTASISIVLLAFLVKGERVSKKAEKPNYYREIKEGLRYMLARPTLRHIFFIAAFFNILITPTSVLTPLQTVRDYGDEAWRLSAVQISFFMGVAIGGIAIGVWGGFKNKFHTIALSSGLFGVAVISMGLVRNFWLYIGCMAIGGFVVSMCQAPIMSLAQSAIEEEWRGRVMSVFSIIGNLAFPLGMTIWGPLADIVPVGWCLIASGIGMFGISARVARLSYSKP